MYQSLGIAEDMISHGSMLQHVTISQLEHIKGSLKFGDIGTGLSPFPFILSLPQDTHEGVLFDHLDRAGVSVEWSTSLESLQQHDDGVIARIRGPHSDHEEVSASHLAGCDGARSTVRKPSSIKSMGVPTSRSSSSPMSVPKDTSPLVKSIYSLPVATFALQLLFLEIADTVALVWYRKV
jgi:2-polyprenyl-6-methoxyphenol hydroxylase-like FAD-dependent oxidoreductase